MLEIYNSSLIGLWLILVTIVLQAMIAIRVHRAQKGGYTPGVLRPELGQSSFVFRAHRTFQNSMENIVPILGLAFIAIFAEYSAFKLSVIVWVSVS